MTRALPLVLVAVSIVGAPLGSSAAGRTGVRPEVLWREPSIGSVSISPNGDWVVGVAQHERTWGVFVQRRGQAIPRPVYASRQSVAWTTWVGRDSLFIRHSFQGSVRAVVLRLRFDEGKILHDTIEIQSPGWLVDPLPDEDEFVLWGDAFDGKYAVRRGPVSALALGPSRKKARRWVEGELEVVASQPNPVVRWVTDRKHVVRAALTVEGRWNPHWALRYRRGPDDGWQTAWEGDIEGPEDLIPVGITRDDRHLIVLAYGSHDTRGMEELDPESGELVRELYRRPDVDLSDVLFDYDGIDVIAVAYDDGGQRRYHYFDEFREKHLPDTAKLAPGERVAVASSSRDHRFFALSVHGDREPGEFYFLDKERNELVKLGRINDAIHPEKLVPVQCLEVVSADGTKLEAYLARPDRADGRPPPLVVIPHGGPIGVRDSGYFDPLTQYLATAGLAVLRVNYRGSAGFGRSFLEAGAKEWGRGIEDDIDAAVDAVIERGWVDPARMCIAGGSYGGYSAVMSTIRRPDRYRCAVTINGVSDLPLMIWNDSAAPWAARWLVEHVGDPKEEFDRLIEVSPAYHVDQLKAPIFIIHGSEDQRVDPEQSYRLRAMMEAQGKPYEWLEIPHMEHSPSTVQWRMIGYALKWFVQCHLGEIDPPESRKWHGRSCKPLPRG